MRTPGAMILEKDPLFMLFLHESSVLVARSRSTSLGRLGANAVSVDFGSLAGHHRKS